MRKSFEKLENLLVAITFAEAGMPEEGYAETHEYGISCACPALKTL